MAQQEFDFSVIDINLEDGSANASSVGCYISLDGQEIDCIQFGDTDHRLVLGLEKSGAILRATVKSLVNEATLGSISFASESFYKNATKSTKEIWVTLFDHEDDDLYDGNFKQDDTEKPRILVSLTKGDSPTIRKQGATKTTTTRVCPKKIEVRTPIETSSVYSGTVTYTLESFITELRNLTKEGIETLRSEIDDINFENNEKVTILANLEVLHKELQGEHVEDLKFTESLEAVKDQIEKDFSKQKEDLDDELKALLTKITKIMEDMKQLEEAKEEATNENQRLKKIVDTPEDPKESGLTQQAVDLRQEDSKLKDLSDQLTTEFTTTKDGRNEYIQQHSDLAEELESTIQKFHDQLRILTSDVKILSNESDKLKQEEGSLIKQDSILKRRLPLTKFDLKSFRREYDRIKIEYSDSDAEFIRYISELRKNIEAQKSIIDGLLKEIARKTNESSDFNNKSQRQKSQIAHLQEELDKIAQIKYEENYTKLSGELRKAEEQRKAHQDALENAQGCLSTKLQLFSEELDARKAHRIEQEGKIDEVFQNLEAITTEINNLLKEIEVIETRVFTDGNRNRLNDKLSEERESLDNKLQFYFDEKNKLLSELKEALADFDQRQDKVTEQERLIASLQSDIKQIKVLIEEKKEIIIQLEQEIHISNERIEELQKNIDDRDKEIEDMLRMLAHKDARIEELTAFLGDSPPPPKQISYKAKKGDEVDELLAQYIQDCPVPVKRLGRGFYLFGTKKIYAKIMNCKLVIRVGGGYMIIQKFIETYADQELVKIKLILEREGFTSLDELDLEKYCLNKGKTAYGNVPGEKSPGSSSPGSHGGSFKKSFSSAVSKTTTRSKTVKTVSTTKVAYQN
ncbi:unnamed protein product [Moneuplotes crassus]|uniref:GAR domain-containing protein n=2 Tax=Euplotes crassus TaxID=5936 RepID=A0AAD1Y539_EUPCR|nr:unnamed protein product [Moneuplotes crassus]